MEQQQRVLLAITVSLLIWLGYVYYFMPKPTPPEAPREAAGSEVVSTDPARSGSMAVAEPSLERSVDARDVSGLEAAEATQEREELEIRVETPRLRVVLTNRGGVIRAVALKAYQGDDEGPLELLPLEAPRGYRYPGTLELDDEGLAGPFLDGTYEPLDGRDLDLSRQPGRREISFRRVADSGFQVTKTYRFEPDSYLIGMEVELANLGETARSAGYRLYLGGDVLHESTSSRMQRGIGSVALIDGQRVFEKPDEEEPFRSEGSIDWISLTDQYFVSALLPGRADGLRFDLLADPRKGVLASLGRNLGLLGASQSLTEPFQFYFGPKDADDLVTVGSELDRVVDMGFFSFLAKPLQRALKRLQGMVGGYGLAIILLTLGVRILLLPLTFVQLKSMKGMQAIQPKVAALKAQLKSNPKKLNEETMKLYKQEGVNPFAGCLPILVQLPVFFALYTVLLNTIGLRQASFLWVADLAQPNPALVILMGISQFLSQKLTPTSGDPKQAQMMMLMPVFFVVMFWRWPAGLVLYWLTSNLVQIIQQLVMNARFRPQTAADSGKA